MGLEKIIISGGPHTGKSTLIRKLKTIFPNFNYIPEAGEIVISKMLKSKGMKNFSWNIEFQNTVIKEQIEQESKISGISILDRSLFDCSAYLKLYNYNKEYLETLELAKKSNYSKVFFCDFVGSYTKNKIRRETHEQAREIHEALRKVYKISGIEFIEIPNVNLDFRIELVKKHLINI